MKKIELILMSILSIGMINIYAQGYGNFSPELMAERQTQRLTQELDLTKGLIPQVQALNEKYAQLMVDARKSGLDRTDMIFKIKELQENKKKEMKLILSKEQFKKYRKYLNQHQNNMQQRYGGGKGHGGDRGQNF